MNLPLPHTLHELQLLPQYTGTRTVFDLFNQTRTYGGREQLRKLFTSPCADAESVRQRQKLLKFITVHLDALTVNVKPAYVLAAESYLTSNLAWVTARSWVGQYRQALWFSQLHTQDFTRLKTGLSALQLVLQTIEAKTRWLHETEDLPNELAQLSETLRLFFSQERTNGAVRELDQLIAIVRADRLLRHELADSVREVLALFYQLDAYCAVCRFTSQDGWVYPTFVDGKDALFEVSGLVHPLLSGSGPVHNEFRLLFPHRLAIVTGGNMSGKTTFLKACGIAVYLAHLGLAIPATEARLTFFDELITSIHLTDNLEAGHSHFYSELVRLNTAMDALRNRQRVFLLADELFRGTNPQDAIDCTRLVLDKLIHQRNSLFLVSSHLPGIGKLYETEPGVRFICFRTQVEGRKLLFRYAIEPEVAEERSGRLLLEQMGLLDQL